MAVRQQAQKKKPVTKIAILGEAWGEQEARERVPFVGFAGQELTRMLSEAGIHRAECFLTNVFNQHPPGNNLEWFCGPKAEALPGYPMLKSKYVRAEFAPELKRLGEEFIAANPNIIIALGNAATWAMLGRTAITKYRGTTAVSTHTITGFKILSTFHPSYILRGQWELRSTVILDLVKARREAEFPDLRRPQREIWIEPTLEDIYEFERQYLNRCRRIAIDIETAGNQITCIGFSPDNAVALVIPFADSRRTGRSYWPDKETEVSVWRFVRKILTNRGISKTFQNGLYDITFLWRAYGIPTLNAEHDTMLLHHALQPEALKGLGFLGSVYTDEGPWKEMRERTTTLKKDE